MVASGAEVSLVGRSQELAALRRALSVAGQGEPSVTLVGGDAGIGKSRLVDQLMREAAAAGTLVLEGQCVALEGGALPYAPVVAALRDAEETAAHLPAPARAELARVLPGLEAPLGADGVAGRPTRYDSGRLFELLFALLRRLAAPAPVLLVIEDVQWADAATRDFLAFLAANVTHERLAAVVTYRSEGGRRDAPLRALLTRLNGLRVERLDLQPLGRDAVEAQLDQLLGAPAPRRVLETIHGRAQGNPLFVRALLAAWRAGEADALPETLRDALLLRIDALPPATREVLAALAAIGRPAGAELLGRVAGAAPAEAERRLVPALRAGIVTLGRDSDLFAFGHALMREAILSELLPNERRRLHAAAADALTAAGDAPAGELALHHDRAGRQAPALVAHVEAGLAAEAMYAYTDAAAHFERALALWSPDADAALDHVGVLAHAAEAARMLGDWDGAAERCLRALGELDHAADPRRAAQLYERLGEYRFWDDDAALAAYTDALRILPAGCDTERAHLLAAQSLTLHYQMRWSAARRLAEEALALARGAGAAAEEAFAELTLGTAMAFLGDPEGGREHVTRALRLSVALGWAEGTARAYCHLAEVLRIDGDLRGACDVTCEGAAKVEEMGMSESFGRSMRINAAEDLLRLGRFGEATAQLRATQRLELRFAAALLHDTVTGRMHLARGEWERSEAALERARARCDGPVNQDYLSGVYAAFAELAVWRRRPAEAAREVAAGLAAVGSLEDPLYTPQLYSLAARAAADLAEIARTHADRAEAERRRRDCELHLQRLDALVARHSARMAPPEAAAHRALCAAELARAEQRPAPALWLDAAERWERLAQPLPAAYAHWRAAQAMLRAGDDRREAAEVLARARAVAERLGAAPLLAEVEALAAAAHLQRPPEGAPEEVEDLGLTPRELEVLRLVAQGKTNEQIGEQLFISRKTASVHVTRILRKLDAGNRTVAADRAHQLGLI